MGLGGAALANGAAPNLPLTENYLALSGLAIGAVAVILLPIPYIYKWDWQARFYGASLFGIASVACMGIYPLLCIVLYSHLSFAIRFSVALMNSAIIIWWCLRFVKIYKFIFSDDKLFNAIYHIEEEEIYFFQQGDKFVLEKKLKFAQFPPGFSFIIFMAIAIILALFHSVVVDFVEIPFPQIFLAVSMVPVNLAFLGLATKMWLLFFTYPKKLKIRFGKTTYVDMVSKSIK